MRRAYNKTEFQNILCSNCSVCDDYSISPEWCYALYKLDPEEFLQKCYSKLVKLSSWSMGSSGLENKNLELQMFRSLFCKADLCRTLWTNGEAPGGDNCLNTQDCLKQFLGQISPSGTGFIPNSVARPKTGKRNKRKKEKYICQPYPTFFISGRTGWEEEIHTLLEEPITETDEYTVDEPDHNTANTPGTEGHLSGQA